MKKICSILSVFGFLFVSTVARAQFATSVIAYTPGTGAAAGFTNPLTALGKPASGASISPFSPPFSTNQLVSVGTNGFLTLQFNPPIVNQPSNPYGLDFLVFGNSFFTITNHNFSGGGLTDGTIGGNNPGGTRVEVSADGSNWFTLNPALTPTVDSYYPTDGAGDPQIPVNPALVATNFTGLGLPGIRSNYNGSAGGGGFDLAWAQDTNGNTVDLPIVRFVRVDVLTNKSEVDAISEVRGATPYFSEDFFTDPAEDGWRIFGDTNLFIWNPTNKNLEVIWDSSQPNSYYFHSLGTILGQDDDFQFSFDLQLSNIVAGVNPNKPDALQVAVGFLNFAGAADPGFVRAVTGQNLAEFDYFPAFVDPMYGPSAASISPAIISTNSNYYSAFGYFFTFTNGASYRVKAAYTAASGLLVTTVTLSGQTNILDTVITSPAVPGNDGFRLDTFAIASYTDTGDAYDSLLASGTVDNLVVTLPPPPIQNIAAVSNAAGSVQFNSRSNWLYTLLRTGDLQSWSPASAPAPGTGGTVILSDTNPPAAQAFYRVSATRP